MEKTEFLDRIKHQALQQIWGFSQFHPLQEEVVDHILSGSDTVVLFPTGGGKSLCYQLPAIISEGTCLVISPLLALMKDQVLQLQNKGVEAQFLSSEFDDAQQEKIFQHCKEGLTKILYISPERLTNRFFLENIQEIDISFIAVDEAHCISEWGQDFRPSYQNIKNFRRDFKNVPCLALTATATAKVLAEIVNKLELKKPKVFKRSFNRENIQILTEKISDKYTYISDFLQFNPTSGIIYTRTRKDAEQLSAYLKSRNKTVDFYHAGLPTSEKNKKQKEWLQRNDLTLISTNAFGMGVDKDNVRFVIHLSPPASVENYFQEIGRAGRDGEKSAAILLWNFQENKNLDELFNQSIPGKSEYTRIIQTLYSIYQIGDFDDSDRFYQFNLQKLKNLTKVSGSKIQNVLGFLNNQELIFYSTQQTPSTLELKISIEHYEELPKRDAYLLELLLRLLPGLSSQKVYFSDKTIAAKMGVTTSDLQGGIRDLVDKNFVEYVDGAMASVKFLVPRNDQYLLGKWWHLFHEIQKNKIKKWEELKYFVEENAICKMKMILAYFGEKNIQDCGQCQVCLSKKDHFLSLNLAKEIINVLHHKPATIEEIFIKLSFHKREKIRENLIYLLDAGDVEMLDFRTYTLP